MNIEKNIIVAGKHQRDFLLDLFFVNDAKTKPLLIFAHGFKGFKDWGHWDEIAQTFAAKGYAFLKFNFSHNGTTLDDPLNFADLEAFGQNNYTKELADLDAVLEWSYSQKEQYGANIDLENITLIGHSRGGGLGWVKAASDARIKRFISWASVDSLSYFWEQNELLRNAWKERGVHLVLNGRTKQEMPLYYQLLEDFDANGKAYDVESAARSLQKPVLIVHGEADPAVPVAAAQRLKAWCPSARLVLIPEGDHVFGGSHPFSAAELPEATKRLIQSCLAFLQA